MASRPHFDLNRRENVGEAGLNFAMQAVYEPGSTFKIVSAGAALNEGLVTPQTSIFCHNGLYQEVAYPGAGRCAGRHAHGGRGAPEIEQYRGL